MTYNTAGERASYTVVLSGTSQAALQELFTYRGDQIGQVLYTGTSITDTYTDTYLYDPNGGQYELIRQYTSKVTCGWAWERGGAGGPDGRGGLPTSGAAALPVAADILSVHGDRPADAL
jgi:hypothetical protein